MTADRPSEAKMIASNTKIFMEDLWPVISFTEKEKSERLLEIGREKTVANMLPKTASGSTQKRRRRLLPVHGFHTGKIVIEAFPF